MDFIEFFTHATDHHPYPYQVELAKRENLPALLKIPTGAGKTETAVLGWLYRYFEHPDSMPRRLVYCLPMRTLVEQTAARVQDWLKRLSKTEDVGVVILMGGEPRVQWYLHPEKPYIIIGTQDMLLSRALNRGYGSTPFIWPVEYGLLNNDCFWVMDEVQLMDNGLPTSTQLAGLRRKLNTFGPTHSMWMSATVRPGWLSTIDHNAPTDSSILELGSDDLVAPTLRTRHNACKVVTEIPVADGRNYAHEMAKCIAVKHEPGTLTLAIFNTVERSQEVYKALNNRRRISLDVEADRVPNLQQISFFDDQDRWRVSLDAEKVLIHSRFREADRKEKTDFISADPDPLNPGKIVIATQAIEAGVDISARTLITELAPWPSLVQRFGRCNRKGEYEQGDVFWVDPQNTAPYDLDDVESAHDLMKSLEGKSVGPSDLEELGDAIEDVEHLTVIRRRDVVGLFDTTSDLSGSYLDVSQYVRGTDARDVSVFWRDIFQEGPDEREPKPRHFEIVGVPIGGQERGPKGIRDYLEDEKRKAWRWDFLDNRWIQVQDREIYPGMTLLLDANHGGYSSETGWNLSVKDRVEPVSSSGVSQEPVDSSSFDLNSTSQRTWTTLADHSRHVESEMKGILDGLSGQFMEQSIRETLMLTALYHDAGKAHPAFQEMLRKALPEGKTPPVDDIQMAKSPGNGKIDAQRQHFRHELGSALAILEHANELEGRTRDLAMYLAAAHHGKVRLGIRSLPGKRRGNTDRNPNPNYLLGYHISKPETLPPVEFGEGLRIDETKLDLSIARIGLADDGQCSWLERSLGLLDWLGPFRLAYLEAIVRAADMRASKDE